MNLAQLDLNLLVTLDALLREKNVTRAGRRVGLSQPAASAALGRLRDLFDDPLLVRVGRVYHLTPLAAELQEPVQRVLVLVERTLERRVVFEPKTARRDFRIAASDYVLLAMARPLIARIAGEAPNVRLDFRPLRDDTSRLLSARRLDLVVHPRGALRGFESQVLFEDRWVCAFWQGNTAIRRRIDKKLFGSLPHVRFSFAGGLSSEADRHLDNLGVQRRVDVTTESFAAAPFLLERTPLLALVPERLLERTGVAAKARSLPPPYEIPPLVESMSWNTLDSSDAAHAWLRRTLADVASEL